MEGLTPSLPRTLRGHCIRSGLPERAGKSVWGKHSNIMPDPSGHRPKRPCAYMKYELHPNAVFIHFIRVYYASVPGFDVFCKAPGDRRRGAPLATAPRTPGHNSQCM